MTFDEALQEALKGKVIGRSNWPATDSISLKMLIHPGQLVRVTGVAVHSLRPGMPHYQPTQQDIVADDWMAVE